MSQAGRESSQPFRLLSFLPADQPVLHTGILAVDAWVRMILSVWPWVLPKVGQRSSRQPGSPTLSQEGRSRQAVLGQSPMKLTTEGDTTEVGSVLFALHSSKPPRQAPEPASNLSHPRLYHQD